METCDCHTMATIHSCELTKKFIDSVIIIGMDTTKNEKVDCHTTSHTLIEKLIATKINEFEISLRCSL